MIAPIEQPSRLQRYQQAEPSVENQSDVFPTSFDLEEVGVLRRKYHQWVSRHPIGAATAAIAIGLTMGLLLKRRSRK